MKSGIIFKIDIRVIFFYGADNYLYTAPQLVAYSMGKLLTMNCPAASNGVSNGKFLTPQGAGN